MKKEIITWTQEDDDIISNFYKTCSDEEISETLGNKTKAQVQRRRMELGLKKQRQTVNKEKIEGMKWCWYCNEFHELDAFNNNKSKPDGKQDECRIATKLIGKERNKQREKYNIIKEKTCSKCGETKLVESFIKNASTYDGYSKLCVECLNKNEILRKYRNIDKKAKIEPLKINNNLDKKHFNKSKDVYGNIIKIDEEKVKGIDIEAILEDVKNTDKNINEIDYNLCSMEFESNVNMFIQNISKYIYNNETYKLNEIDLENKYKFLYSLEQLNKTINKFKNIIY